MNATPHGMNAMRRRMNPIPDGIHVSRAHINAMPRGMNAIGGRMNPIHGSDSCVHGSHESGPRGDDCGYAALFFSAADHARPDTAS